VTIQEIADLLHDLRAHSYPAPADPDATAELQARKADLLARIEREHNHPATPQQ